MEVGAVKQAYNNEVILLKKNLNQARIQIIHKLTRKAKTLAEKKGPEHLKEKNKKKAESAVNEVLIIKKLKARDIATFIITHKGELKQHLNKPQADKDKACARLLLHKSLQQKYKSIKEKFGDVPIGDLLMSRQERRKLKKEQMEQQKNKKKVKGDKVVNSEGDWDVEDVKGEEMNESSSEKDDDQMSVADSDDQTSEVADGEESEAGSDDQNAEVADGDQSEVDDEQSEAESINQEAVSDDEGVSDVEMNESDEENEFEASDSDDTANVGHFVKLNSKHSDTKQIDNNLGDKTKNDVNKLAKVNNTKTKTSKKVKEHKNKKLDDKILNRKFKKSDEGLASQQKVVDPFFITESGENYMSIAEPRQPDEVKEIHKQGNRKLRRAIMFGHVPKPKPREFKQDNYNKQDSHNNKDFNNRYKSNDRQTSYNNSKFNNDKFHNSKDTFNNTNDKFNNTKDKFNNKFNDKKFNNNRSEVKEEKLHPSWEAKKKQSGILPFQGKKIVFEDS